MSKPLRVLLIGEDPGDVRSIGEMLDECGRGVALVHCENPEEGPAVVSGDGFEVALLDLDLLDGRGAAIVGRLREAAPDLPIIVITATGDDPAVLDAMQLGAQDYLIKGKTDAELLGRAVRYALKHRRVERALRHSEETYRRLVENLNEGVLALDEAGYVTFANPRMEEILGCPAGHLIGLPVAGFVERPACARRIENPFCRRTNGDRSSSFDLLSTDGGESLRSWSRRRHRRRRVFAGCMRGCSTSRPPNGRGGAQAVRADSTGLSWRASARAYGSSTRTPVRRL
jgi:PAS domain S-box-containing protein